MQIEMGGYSLAADVVSGGAPPAVFISGRGDGREVWASLLPLLRSDCATITYDRSGIGDSGVPPISSPRAYSALARELTLLLRAIPLTGPFVVVGHSLGALVARYLAAIEPDLVCGLVLVDSSVDELELWPGERPLLDGSDPGALPLDPQGGAAEMAMAADPVVPAVVLTRTPGRWQDPRATAETDQKWIRHHRELAHRLNAPLLIASDAGHYIQRDAPGLTAFAVDEVIKAVRASQPAIRFDSTQVVAAGGRLAP